MAYFRDLPPARGGPTLPEARTRPACTRPAHLTPGLYIPGLHMPETYIVTCGLYASRTDVIRAKMASREPRFDRLTTHTQCKRVVSCLTDVTRSDRCHMYECVIWITNNPPDALSRMHVTAVAASDP